MSKIISIAIFAFLNILIGFSQEGLGVELSGELEHKLKGLTLAKSNQSQSFEKEDSFNLELFHRLTKVNRKPHQLGFPFIGDFHFINYSFVEPSAAISKYNYFLGTAEIYPSVYVFDKSPNRFNFRLTFGLDVRAWNNRRKPLRYYWPTSHAIKTPSYRPGIFYSRLVSQNITGRHIKTRYIELGLAHHSNGQDAPTLIKQDSTFIYPYDAKYNLENGDFSTNNLSLAYFISDHVLNQSNKYQSFNLVIDGFSNNKILREDLHRLRLSYKIEFTKYKRSRYFNERVLENQKLGMEVGFGMSQLDQFNLTKNLKFVLQFQQRISFAKNLFFIIQYKYIGQDDYNIYLEHSVHSLRLGISNSLIMNQKN